MVLLQAAKSVRGIHMQAMGSVSSIVAQSSLEARIYEVRRYINESLYYPTTIDGLKHDPYALRLVANDIVTRVINGEIRSAEDVLWNKLDGRGRVGIIRKLTALNLLPKEWEGGELKFG